MAGCGTSSGARGPRAPCPGDPPEVRALSRLTTATSALRSAEDIGPRFASGRSSRAAPGPRNGCRRRRPASPTSSSGPSRCCRLRPSRTHDRPDRWRRIRRGSSGRGRPAWIWQPERTRASMITSSPARCAVLETTMGSHPLSSTVPNRTNEGPSCGRARSPGPRAEDRVVAAVHWLSRAGSSTRNF